MTVKSVGLIITFATTGTPAKISNNHLWRLQNLRETAK